MTKNYRDGGTDPQIKVLEEEGGEKISKYSSTYLWEKGVVLLKSDGIAITPSDTPEGVEIRHLEEPKPVRGFNPEKGFKFFCPINNNNSTKTFRKIDEILKRWNESEESEALAKYWSPLVNPTSNSNRLKEMADYQLRIMAKSESSGTNKTLDNVTLEGNKGSYKFLPLEKWFSEEIKQLKAEDLAPFFYPAELELFQMQIGRAIVGRTNSVTIESTLIDHTFRNFTIIIGKEAGMGKSTLMDYITRALSYCGYKIATIHDNERFGWGEIIRSDIAYLDDLTEKGQKAFITSSNTKQAVSNGTLSTERKGVDPINHRSRTTLIACSNSFNPSDFYEMDEGLISRCKLLYSMNYAELESQREKLPTKILRDSKNLRIKEHWSHLSEITQTEPLTLALYFCHLSAKKFLKETGYEYIYPKGDEEKELGSYKQSPVNLLQKTKIWTNQLVIQSGKNNSQTLLAIAFFLLVWGETIEKELELNYYKKLNQHKIEKNYPIPNMIHLVFTGNKIFTDKKYEEIRKKMLETVKETLELGDLNSCYNPFNFNEKINLSTIEKSLELIPNYLKFHQQEHDYCKYIFNNIRTNQGFKLVGEISWIQNYWNDLFTYRNNYKNLAQELNKKLKESGIDINKKYQEIMTALNQNTSDLFYPKETPFIYPTEEEKEKLPEDT